MKLLLLTPQLPYPPHQGTTIRNFNILKGLAARHEIHLLSFGEPEELADSPLPQYCKRIEIVAPPVRTLMQRAVETFLSPLPDMARRLHSPTMTAKYARLQSENRYDVIQIEGIEMAPYWSQSSHRPQATGHRSQATSHTLQATGHQLQAPGNLEPATRNLQPVPVFDDHNAEYVLQKTAYEADRKNARRLHAALYSYIQWHKLARFERELCLRAGHVVAVSQYDANAIHHLDPRIQPVVIPNGVDVEYYIPSTEVCAKPLADLSAVFTGKMDFRPNIDAATWFAHEILPALRREIPLAHISFVGQKPSPRVQALADEPGVEVTGWVPDTRPYIADAAVYAVPLRMGGGTRLKVLEAMAMGKAIVSTTLGAEGIEYIRDRDLVIADGPEEFARAIAALLRNPDRRRELGANARKLAEEKYDWNKLVPLFETLYALAR
ncbi:MAG: glycosyltransferase [Anaerolineae bacterium]